jgi:hypothetical protein
LIWWNIIKYGRWGVFYHPYHLPPHPPPKYATAHQRLFYFFNVFQHFPRAAAIVVCHKTAVHNTGHYVALPCCRRTLCTCKTLYEWAVEKTTTSHTPAPFTRAPFDVIWQTLHVSNNRIAWHNYESCGTNTAVISVTCWRVLDNFHFTGNRGFRAFRGRFIFFAIPSSG